METESESLSAEVFSPTLGNAYAVMKVHLEVIGSL